MLLRNLPPLKSLRHAMLQYLISEILVDRVTANFDEGEEVTLPGFNILEQFGPYKALAWWVPKPLDEIDLALVYDDLVERPGLRSTQKSIRHQNLLDAVGFGDFFPEPRSRSEWFEPLALVIGLVGVTRGEYVRVMPGAVSTSTDIATYDVRAYGAWSNVRQLVHRAAVPATDTAMESMRVPELRTDHPLARALVGANARPPALWLANLLLQRPGMPRVAAYYTTPPGNGKRYVRKKRANHRPDPSSVAYRTAVVHAYQVADDNASGAAQEIERCLKGVVLKGKPLADLLGNSRGREEPLHTITRRRILRCLNELGAT